MATEILTSFSLAWAKVNSIEQISSSGHQIRVIKESTSVNSGSDITIRTYGSNTADKETVVLLFGATGSGKSTLVNVMVNFLLDSLYEDQPEFQVVTDTIQNPVESQTRKITVYKFNLSSETFTIVDTPGFGDTRGIEQDKQTMDMIKTLLSQRNIEGIPHVNAVGFVVPALMARLTPTQTYILDQMMCILGKDVIDNIVFMFPFADIGRPLALRATKHLLDSMTMPLDRYFKFNNSPALFGKEQSDFDESFADCDMTMGSFDISEQYRIMNKLQYDKMFRSIRELQAKTLDQTSEVLELRTSLQHEVKMLQPKIEDGLAELGRLENLMSEVGKVDKDSRQGQPLVYTTTASSPDDKNFFKIKYLRGRDRLFSWCTASKLQNPDHSSLSDVVSTICVEFVDVRMDVPNMIIRMKETVNRLREIALAPILLSTSEYIDVLIETEKCAEDDENKPDRIRQLEDIRKEVNLMHPDEEYDPYRNNIDSLQQKAKDIDIKSLLNDFAIRRLDELFQS